MIDLLKFYKDNIKEDDYFYRFYKSLVSTNEQVQNEFEDVFGGYMEYKTNYEIYDDEDAIKNFRDLCEPNLSWSIEKTSLFYLLCFYLNTKGYKIEEFPRILERPPMEPIEFTQDEIRNMALSQNLDSNGTVRYQTRRKLVASFHFVQDVESKVNEDVNLKFQEISTRNARFESMATDEKIKEILNLIENFLKRNGKYIELDYQIISLGIINDQVIKDFKNKMQCFRHSSDESLQERKRYSDSQKKFIIDYGIMLCNLIYENK